MDEVLQPHRFTLPLNPDNLQLRSNIATLVLMNGEPREAVVRYEAIPARDPSIPEVWLNPGIAYAQAGQIEPAREAWRRVLHDHPDYPAA